MSSTLAFTDCETTHLSADIGEVWEVAVVLRDDDGGEAEYVWQFAPDLGKADPESLKIGRFDERFVVPVAVTDAAFTGYPDQVVPMTRSQAVSALVSVLRGATIVGSNPAFDDRHLRKLVGPGNQQWAYRPKCIATYAEGFLRGIDPHWVAEQEKQGPMISSRALSRRLGVEPPGPDVAHTALGDARWAKAVYDAVATFANADQVYRDAYATGRTHAGADGWLFDDFDAVTSTSGDAYDAAAEYRCRRCGGFGGGAAPRSLLDLMALASKHECPPQTTGGAA